MIGAVKQNRLVSLKLVVNGSTVLHADEVEQDDRGLRLVWFPRIDQYRCYRAVGRTRRQRTDRLNFQRIIHPRRIDSKPIRHPEVTRQDPAATQCVGNSCKIRMRQPAASKLQVSHCYSREDRTTAVRVARRESSTSSMRRLAATPGGAAAFQPTASEGPVCGEFRATV
jgi:hypothetical protein